MQTKHTMMVQFSAQTNDGRSFDTILQAENQIKALINAIHAGLKYDNVTLECLDDPIDVPVIIIVERDGVLHTHVFETRGGNADANCASDAAAKFLNDMGEAKAVRCWITPMVASYVSPDH